MVTTYLGILNLRYFVVTKDKVKIKSLLLEKWVYILKGSKIKILSSFLNKLEELEKN